MSCVNNKNNLISKAFYEHAGCITLGIMLHLKHIQHSNRKGNRLNAFPNSLMAGG